ncbi:MAG: fibronectin type III domain-containing protein [Verrucomicrobia bacterium]|nr:fibronectin type III domain-containing protein [Verrucomicrobiota bacterium]
MKPPFKHLSPFLVRCFLATLLGASASSALAVAPARPIINSKIEFTRSGFKDSGVDTGGNTHSYLIRWERKSVDEEGFRINITGAVTTSQLAGAGSQSAIVSLPGLAEGLKLNFTVTAWKYNGTVIESATSGSATFTIPAGLNGPGTFGTPTAFSVKRATRKVTVGGTEQTVNDDGVLEFTWTDNSTAELFNQIQYREVSGPANQWSHLAFVNFSTSGVTIDSLRPRLIPSTAYQFRIRATVQASLTSNGSLESSVVDFTTAPLTGPESLSAEVMRENLVRLTWRDNSSNETSYDISRNDGSGNFISLGQVGENVTSVNIPINQGTVNEWRVTAVHQSPPIGSSTLTTIRSANSNSVTLSSSFPAPTEVMAATSGFANTIDVSWKDNSNSEYGYNIYCRAQGETTYNFARAVPAGVTQISVNSQALTTTNEIPNFTPLQAGVSYEFVVRAVNSSESIFSVDSSPASANSNRATAKDGFTASVSARQGFMSQLSTGGEAGQAFTYTLATSNVGNRSTWTVSGLENTGLTFSDSTGIISGSQPMSGLIPN